MKSTTPNSIVRKGKLKKQARLEAMRLEKERLSKLREQAGKRDLLDDYSAFRTYTRHGVEAKLSSVLGSELSAEEVDECIALQKLNLSGVGAVEGWDEAAARSALRHDESRLLLLHGSLTREEAPGSPEAPAALMFAGGGVAAASPAPFDDWVVVDEDWSADAPSPGPPPEERPPAPPPASPSPPPPPLEPPALLGYLHLQFCIREKDDKAGPPLLCVLNMQLAPDSMGKGLGKFALQLCELIARKNGMELVMLFMQDGSVQTMRLTKHKPHVGASPPAVRGPAEPPKPLETYDAEDFELISRPPCVVPNPTEPMAVRC